MSLRMDSALEPRVAVETSDAAKAKYTSVNYYRTADGKASAGSISGRRGVLLHFFGDIAAGISGSALPSVPRPRKEHDRQVVIGGPTSRVKEFAGNVLLTPQIPTQRARGGKPCTLIDTADGSEWTVYIHGGRQRFLSALNSTLKPVRPTLIQMGTSKPVGPFG